MPEMAHAGRRGDGMAPARDSRRWAVWLLWLGVLTVITAAMTGLRTAAGEAHVALVYLLIVLGASAHGGRVLGLLLALTAFLCFNFFFLPPFHTLGIADPFDWVVLAAFLVTSAVAAHLLARARKAADVAGIRAAEVDWLATLGAEALNAGRAEEALAAIAEIIRTTLDLSRCDIFVHDATRRSLTLAASCGTPAVDGAARPDADAETPNASHGTSIGIPSAARLAEWVAENARAAAERQDGAIRFGDTSTASSFEAPGARTLLLPLRVRDRTVGVLRVGREAALVLDPPRLRLLDALAYYAALGVERARLAAEAERADALRSADQMKDALLASVSHDLRTPLTTIKALAHDMAAGGDDRAVTIEEEADRLNRFVGDLLDLTRVGSGALVVTPEINAAEDLVGTALQRVAGTLGDRTVTVTMDPSEPLLVGRFDFVHALRALVNLLENAIKYSPPDAPIDLDVRCSDGTLAFAVSDQGPGVPPGEEERIFAPFYRPPGRPPDVGGAGLGLSIARRLAEAQGGSVCYEPAPGGGSRFILRLPAATIAELEA